MQWLQGGQGTKNGIHTAEGSGGKDFIVPRAGRNTVESLPCTATRVSPRGLGLANHPCAPDIKLTSDVRVVSEKERLKLHTVTDLNTLECDLTQDRLRRKTKCRINISLWGACRCTPFNGVEFLAWLGYCCFSKNRILNIKEDSF
jgi:hypothetical protein